ncbi:DUF3782 domain-containing protein [Candidatus Bathyarchaeota archaeon]|nr:DUF3782 domain-containing protein [Candidatus Bathyarchaeota archaeon]
MFLYYFARERRRRRDISASGARWGLVAEETFRQNIGGSVEKEFGFQIERWTKLTEKV